jgi:hypothetical protein
VNDDYFVQHRAATQPLSIKRTGCLCVFREDLSGASRGLDGGKPVESRWKAGGKLVESWWKAGGKLVESWWPISDSNRDALAGGGF